MKDQIINKFKSILYPNFKKDIISLNLVKNIEIKDNIAYITLDIFSSNKDIIKELENNILNSLKEFNLKDIKLTINHPEAPKEQSNSQSGRNLAPQIKHFIMVSSGKGGVGKSTTTVNLAISMAKMGKRVGLLDLDIYGPNIPRMLGIMDEAPKIQGDKIYPILSHGIYTMSMGVLISPGQGLVWRGAMIMKAVTQLLTDVLWGDLDIMFLDMPPGTGDAQLSLAQNVPVSAGVCVSTPQAVSLDDTRRSLDMFDKLHIPVAGIVENMSGFLCPDNGKLYDIFGSGGAEKLAKEYNIDILANIPIEMPIRIGADEGKPISFYDSTSLSSKKYLLACEKILNFLNNLNNIDNSAIQPIY